MKKLFSVLTVAILFSCNEGSTVAFKPHTDTLINTLCVYKDSDSTVTVGYLTRIVRDTMLLSRDTVQFAKDSSKGTISFVKKWLKDTAYFIAISIKDTLTKKPLLSKVTGKDSIGMFMFNYNAVIADCNKNVDSVMLVHKLKFSQPKK